jgi:uncharacterized protein (TIGR02001 family)
MNKVLNKHLLAALCITPLLLGASLAQADDAAAPAAEAAPAAAAAPAAPASPFTITTNVGIYSDYVFRGLSFNLHKATFQGGVDVAHSSGLFAGMYFSSLTPSYNGGNTLEVDTYGGFTHDIVEGVSGTVGAIYVGYPQGKDNLNGGTPIGTSTYSYLEVNAAVTWKGITAKANYDVTEYSGIKNSDGTYYLEAAYNNTLPFYDINYTLHVGHWHQAGKELLFGAHPDYTDYGVSINKNFKIAGTDGWNVGLGVYGADTNDDYYQLLVAPPNGDAFENTGNTRAYCWLKRTF